MSDHQPYLEILAHELLWLYWYGFDVTLPAKYRSNATSSTINVKGMLLQWVADYRGYPKTFRHRQSPHLKFSCYKCDVQGTRISDLKTIFPHAWRACQHPSSKRVNGSRLNNPHCLPSNTPAQTYKNDAFYREAAKEGDTATNNGIKWDNDHHPVSRTGKILSRSLNS